MDDVGELTPQLVAYYSGPDQGIGDISLVPFRQNPSATNKPAAATAPQQQPQQQNSQQLSEQNPNPSTSENTIDTNKKLKETTNGSGENQNGSIYNKPRNAKDYNNISSTQAALLANDCWDSLEKSGISKFNSYHHRAYGIACSLYENNPNTNTTVGDPIADVFAILTRKTSSILVLADGVNWGPRSRLAARCAVRACLNHINKNLYHLSDTIPNSTSNEINNKNNQMTTHDVFKIMCRSFDAAQEYILRKKGSLLIDDEVFNRLTKTI